jgi:2-polyprenyl-3-methyl-5-hydroxy-6-metoxy-1,4-benzoquinol methylase
MPSSSADHWENVHLNKHQDVSWWQDPDDLWLDLFEKAKAKEFASIIDIGAGASLLIDSLLESGYSDVSILDISHSSLSRVRERLGERVRPGNYFVSDVLEFSSERRFDVWHDRAVFHFLTTLETQSAYKKALLDHLSLDGNLILSTFSPTGPESCSGLPVARHSVESLVSLFKDNFDLVYSDERTHRTPWGSAQAFTITIFQRR